jgi:hypothetical protein
MDVKTWFEIAISPAWMANSMAALPAFSIPIAVAPII